MTSLRKPILTVNNTKTTKKKAAAENAAPSAATRPSIRPQRILVYVNAVARHGSIRKAAESLHIASSALNRRILDLESELGLTLFERLPRGVRLTAAGELYVSYVRRTLADLEMVVSRIEQLRGLVRGRVRIAATESVAGHLLPEAIAAFQAHHPGVYFNVTIEGAGHLVDSLASDTADLILTHDLYNRADVTILATAHQPFCALLARTHPLASRSSLRLRDCQAYPIALADETLAGRALIDRALLKTSFQFEPALVSNSIEVMKAFSRTSQAICFQFQIGSQIDDDMVAIPLTDVGLARTQLFLAMRRGRALPSAAAAFSEHLAAMLQEL
jgi:DNA-binding transcriptional LysR family regulator